MGEYWMYFPFFVLHDWGKRCAEAPNPHLSDVALGKKKAPCTICTRGGFAAVPLSFITLETIPLPDALSCSHRPSGLPANGPDSLGGFDAVLFPFIAV